MRVVPTSISSPSRTSIASVMRRPLRNVPLRLLRSSTYTTPSGWRRGRGGGSPRHPQGRCRRCRRDRFRRAGVALDARRPRRSTISSADLHRRQRADLRRGAEARTRGEHGNRSSAAVISSEPKRIARVKSGATASSAVMPASNLIRVFPNINSSPSRNASTLTRFAVDERSVRRAQIAHDRLPAVDLDDRVHARHARIDQDDLARRRSARCASCPRSSIPRQAARLLPSAKRSARARPGALAGLDRDRAQRQALARRHRDARLAGKADPDPRRRGRATRSAHSRSR